MDIEKTLKNLPASCGVYLMRNKCGRVIYIGKAVSLKKRVASYFKKDKVSRKTAVLMSCAASIDCIRTQSEEEALLLEAALIRQKQPRFNVLLKDDKRYPLLKLTLDEKFPRLSIARRKKSGGAVYFGPYTSAGLLRRALAVMRRMFPLRTCPVIPESPCLNYHIGQCVAPCLFGRQAGGDKINENRYKQIVADLILFLKGGKKELIRNLSRRMQAAAAGKNFEEAAFLRDRIQALTVLGRADKAGLGQLQAALDMKKPPLRIEAFDISALCGKEAVGSMVSFFNGRPDKANYKKFRIKAVFGPDDYKMMREVIIRRYRRPAKEGLNLPDLIIIDGGLGHIRLVKRTLNELGSGRIMVIGIAKKEEKVFSSGGLLAVSRDSQAMELIQKVRDEAHRFAQGYHHILRKKLVTGSELDKIPGVGPKRKKVLMKHFSSIDAIMSAKMGELESVIDVRTAKTIQKYFSKKGI